MDLFVLLWTFIFSVGINLAFFLVAFFTKSDKFTDITYALTFISINAFSLFLNQQNLDLTKILVFVLISLWALRLGGYLLFRIFQTKKDARFDPYRNNFLKFLVFWFVQGVLVYIVSIPSLLFYTIEISLTFELYFLTFLLIVPLFFLNYESIADIQKYRFYLKKERPQFISTGLYKYSRYPNYFGEISFWFTLWFFQLTIILVNQNFTNDNLLYLISFLNPTFLMMTIIYYSGIKILDLKNVVRYKENKDYISYVAKTSIIIPFIGKKGHITLAEKSTLKQQ